MGLDAKIFCDCFERGRLLNPPRPRWGIYVDEYGMRDAQNTKSINEFDKWNYRKGCKHEYGILVHYCLGNIWTIGTLRNIIKKHPKKFPIILKSVIYDGSHCGDWLTVEQVEEMKPEVDQLSDIQPADREKRSIVRGFEKQMKKLVKCSLRIKKPIVF